MPDVSGQTEQQAVQALNRAGILASLAFVPGTDPLGTVVGQAKSAGTKLGYHAHVQINLSTGPGDKPKEQVPDVIGKTLSDAVSAMNGASLRLIFVKLPVTQRSQAGKIVQQSPLGGNQAPRNAQVLVFLGAYRSG
jgi:serine/threonine-protein kinase